MSMVRHQAIAPRVPMLLVYSARSWDEVIFRDELLRADARQARFSLVVATTRGPRARPGDLERRIDGRSMLRILLRWGETPRRAYVCGSNAFVEAATGALMEAGVPAERIRTERFGGPIAGEAPPSP
jgi:ferredoxin-NADP reductase